MKFQSYVHTCFQNLTEQCVITLVIDQTFPMNLSLSILLNRWTPYSYRGTSHNGHLYIKVPIFGTKAHLNVLIYTNKDKLTIKATLALFTEQVTLVVSFYSDTVYIYTLYTAPCSNGSNIARNPVVAYVYTGFSLVPLK